MNKTNEVFQKKHLLSTENTIYTDLLDELFVFLTKNDKINRDLTSGVFLSEDIRNKIKKSVMISNSDLVIAGVEEIRYLVKKYTKLNVIKESSDSSISYKGKHILCVQGSALDVLVYERALLNILQRMSGIATETRRYVDLVQRLNLSNPPLIAATRKTPWMHIDKKAVAIGGGATHRIDLSDGILLKDNHLELIIEEIGLSSESEAIEYAMLNAVFPNVNIPVEIEVKTDEGCLAAVYTWGKMNLKNPLIIMFDNYAPLRITENINRIRKNYESIIFEASGGISLDNIEDFARTGVDVISIGGLTHSVKAADISLDFLRD